LPKVGLRYTGKAKVLHFIDMIDEFGIDELRGRVVRELAVKIAPFYGCHVLRPVHVIGRSEAETEQIVDEIIEAVGGEVINYDRESSCCGFHVTMANPDLCAKLNGWNMLNAKDSEADVMVTPCTLCHTVMDGQQHRAEKEIGEKIGLPVLHLPQLIGLALGIGEKRLGLGRHLVNVNGFLAKLVVDYEEPDNYDTPDDNSAVGEELSYETIDENENVSAPGDDSEIPPPLPEESEDSVSDQKSNRL